MAGYRWLFYAPNGFGLGHVTRTLAIARQIRRRAPEDEFLFLTDCEAANVIWGEGFASVKMISHHAATRGLVNRPTALSLNRAVVATAYAAYRPHVMVADSFPLGRSGELAGILPNSSRRVLICREKTKEIREGAEFQRDLQLYNLVLVPHQPGEVEMPVPEGVTAEITGQVLIRSRGEVMSRAEARYRLGLPAEGFVVYVGFGGGGDLQFERFLQMVLGEARRHPDWTFACGLPPLYTGDVPEAPGARVVALRYYPLAETWSAFDAAITALGANTTAELLHHGIPAIYIPRTGMDDDHLARAKRIVSSKAGWVLDPADSASLRRALAEIADADARARASANARQLVPENGAEHAAEYLLQWVRKKQPAS